MKEPAAVCDDEETKDTDLSEKMSLIQINNNNNRYGKTEVHPHAGTRPRPQM